MVGWVTEQEGAHGHHGRGHGVIGHLGPEPSRHPVEVDVGPVGADPPVAEDGQAVGMTGKDPKAQLVAVDRSPLPELGVERVGIARPSGVERVEDRSLIGDRGCCLHCGPPYPLAGQRDSVTPPALLDGHVSTGGPQWDMPPAMPHRRDTGNPAGTAQEAAGGPDRICPDHCRRHGGLHRIRLRGARFGVPDGHHRHHRRFWRGAHL